MKRALLLALLVPLAGCAEPVGPDVAEPVLPPRVLTPSPVDLVLPPVLDETLLYGNKRALEPSDVAVDVPAGVTYLRLAVDSNASFPGAVAMHRPDGTEFASCSATCGRVEPAPQAGAWHIVFAPEVPGEVFVSVWARLRPQVLTPVPPTVSPTPEAEYDALYLHDFDYGAFRYRYVENHTIAVPAGYDALELKALFTPAEPGVSLALLRPDGAAAWTCADADARCRHSLAGPEAGLWTLRYMGQAPVNASVSVYGLRGADWRLAPNMTVYEGGYDYTARHPYNDTAAFVVGEGFSHLGWSVGFRREGLATEGDHPIVLLHDPHGELRARCEPVAGASCGPIEPVPAGVWRVTYLGPATGSVEAEAFAYGRAAPDAPPPADDDFAGADLIVYDRRQSLGDAVFTETFEVPAGYARLHAKSLLLDSTDDFMLYRMWDATGQLRMECRWHECVLPLEHPEPGTWRIEYAAARAASVDVRVSLFA